MLFIYFLSKPTHHTNRNQRDLSHGLQLTVHITTPRETKHLTILSENSICLLSENCCPVGNLEGRHTEKTKPPKRVKYLISVEKENLTGKTTVY